MGWERAQTLALRLPALVPQSPPEGPFKKGDVGFKLKVRLWEVLTLGMWLNSVNFIGLPHFPGAFPSAHCNVCPGGVAVHDARGEEPHHRAWDANFGCLVERGHRHQLKDSWALQATNPRLKTSVWPLEQSRALIRKFTSKQLERPSATRSVNGRWA